MTIFCPGIVIIILLNVKNMMVFCQAPYCTPPLTTIDPGKRKLRAIQ